MNTYSIDEIAINTFIEYFPKIYKSFMDFGGNIYNDIEVTVRIKKLFYACAICNNMNWDFLCKTAIPQLYTITKGFNYLYISKMNENEFENVFIDYPKKHKIEASSRLKMLRELSKNVCMNSCDIFNIILQCQTVNGINGLSNTINSLPVFKDDPLHKKGNLLIQILLREGIVNVEDEYNVEPSIDYHVIRFFLRNGFISLDNTMANRLSSGDSFTVEEITELRTVISNCMKHIYESAKISIAKLGFIAWSVGRDYCRNEYISCEHKKTCPMIRSCKGYKDLYYRKLKEPESNVNYY